MRLNAVLKKGKEKGQPVLGLCFLFFPAYRLGVRVTQLCPTLHDPVDCSLPGSSVRGILQARTLEWVALQAGSLLSEPPGKGSILKKCPIIWETSSSRGAAETTECSLRTAQGKGRHGACPALLKLQHAAVRLKTRQQGSTEQSGPQFCEGTTMYL